MDPTPSDPSTSSAAEAETVGAGLRRVALGVLVFAAQFLPEILIALIGGVVGLIIGLALGVTSTAELFSEAGPWARAGPIALLLPVLTFAGPTLAGGLMGIFGPVPIVIALHSMVLLALRRFRDRHAAIHACAVAYWLPAVSVLWEGPMGALTAVVVAGPFFAILALGVSSTWVGARGVLHGRSPGTWWREADKSMVVSAALLSALGSVGVWLSCVLFCLAPVAPLLLLFSALLATRLLMLGRRRSWAIGVLSVDLLHLLLVALVVVFLVTHQDPSTSP